MPRIIETVVYRIDELSDEAKEAARCWYRQAGLHDEWYDFVYEDFGTICKILGVTLATTPVRLYGGGTRDKPRIMFSGFANQGDGASFQGWWRHARGAGKAIRAHAPKDEELHRIADVLQEVQRRNFWQLGATVRQSGRYCHEYTMAIEVERDSPTWQPPTDGAEDTVTEALRDLARWLYRQLEGEYEHQTSDETVDEALSVNGLTFTAEGRRFG
ncbi:MAG: antitoxin of toxin-antitoxin stability system [Rhodospirillaceae bacterium]|nr:antitoxin of toxin-antitoxin stability system [Rhodospirillaceae bacterium]